MLKAFPRSDETLSCLQGTHFLVHVDKLVFTRLCMAMSFQHEFEQWSCIVSGEGFAKREVMIGIESRSLSDKLQVKAYFRFHLHFMLCGFKSRS